MLALSNVNLTGSPKQGSRYQKPTFRRLPRKQLERKGKKMGIGLFQATSRSSRQPPVPPAAVCRRRSAAGARLICGTYIVLESVFVIYCMCTLYLNQQQVLLYTYVPISDLSFCSKRPTDWPPTSCSSQACKVTIYYVIWRKYLKVRYIV